MIDSTTRLRENRFHIFDPVGLINDTYYANRAIGARRATARPSDDGFAGGSSPLRFAVEAKWQGGGDSDDSSPKLWKMSPAGSPPPETARHLEQPMSPNSRTEAIARGRRELMEMVKDMPESLYELSLKDIVDHNSTTPLAVADEAGGDKKLALMADQKEKRENKRKKAMSKNIARSRSVDNGGYLLKTSVFPISFGMRRRRKTNLISTGSLKAGATSVAAMAAKSVEKEWWRTKPNESDISGGLSSSYSGTSSDSSSRSSSTSSNRHGHSSRFIPGCCSFRGNK